jgi:DNA-binding MarR family transcriptional regulator
MSKQLNSLSAEHYLSNQGADIVLDNESIRRIQEQHRKAKGKKKDQLGSVLEQQQKFREDKAKKAAKKDTQYDESGVVLPMAMPGESKPGRPIIHTELDRTLPSWKQRESYRKNTLVTDIKELSGMEQDVASFLCSLAREGFSITRARAVVEFGFIARVLNISSQYFTTLVHRLKKKGVILSSTNDHSKRTTTYQISMKVYWSTLPQKKTK